METVSDVIIHLRDKVVPLVSGETRELVNDAIYALKAIITKQHLDKRGQANANLIEAAPELLEACKEALSYFKGQWATSNNHPASHYAEYVDTLEKAIANAGGAEG